MHESDIDDSPSKIIPSKTRTPTTLPRSECEKMDTDERMDVFKFIEVNCFCPFNRTIIPKDQSYTDRLKLLNQVHVKSKKYEILKCACSKEFRSVHDLGHHVENCETFQNREISGQFINSLNQNIIKEHFKNTNECAICTDKIAESFSDHYFSERHQRCLIHFS